MGAQHDRVARKTARQLQTDYNAGQGPDVITNNRVVEVETETTVTDAARQLQGFNRPVYVQGADAATTKKAAEHYKDTTIGVMDQNGNIVQRSTRSSGRRK